MTDAGDGFIIRVMRPEEIAVAIEWAAREGWNPGHADAACFATVDPHGFLIGELDGEPAATISRVRFADLECHYRPRGATHRRPRRCHRTAGELQEVRFRLCLSQHSPWRRLSGCPGCRIRHRDAHRRAAADARRRRSPPMMQRSFLPAGWGSWGRGSGRRVISDAR